MIKNSFVGYYKKYRKMKTFNRGLKDSFPRNSHYSMWNVGKC